MPSPQSINIFLPPDPQTSKGTILTTNIDPDNRFYVERADQLKAVAATYPTSITKFFIRVNECIKTK